MDELIRILDSALSDASGFLWGYVLLFALMGTHLYLTIILRFPQRYLLKGIGYCLRRSKEGHGHISNFSSLMVSLAANVGTGNIVGVAVAVSTGGPGAVFWCMITGVLGMATRYAECLLAVRYRVRNEKGQIVGGPMYAIERGMRCRWLAIVFAVFTAIAAFGIGNITQANAVAGVLQESANMPTYATGIILSVLTAIVLLGGLKGIARVCSACVPTMALIYITGCIIVLAGNAAYILPAIELICTCAFTEQAATGGFIGSCIMLAMRTGVARGLFSNEAGLGSAPIISAPVRTPNAVQNALVSSTGPFWDTVVICSMTGITITTCILGHEELGGEAGTLLTYHAFGTIGSIGTWMLVVSLATFVISTILGWSYFGEKALEYLGGQRLIIPYRALWVVAVFVACIIPKSTIVWNFADCANALMAIPNLICTVALSGVLISQTKYYLWENRLDAQTTREIPDKTTPPSEAQ